MRLKVSVTAAGAEIVHWHALLDWYGPGPSDKLPVALDSVVLPEHATVGRAMGTLDAGVDGKSTGATLGTAPGVEDELYVASKPAAFTDPSDEKTTYSRPLGDVTDTPDLVPVIDSASGADAEAPLYTLTKS